MTIKNASEIIIDKLTFWTEAVIAMLPNLLLASVILVVGFALSKIIKRFFKKNISRFIEHKNLVNLLTSILHLVLISITIFTALSVLKLDSTVKTILAGAGVLSLAFAFAFQDIAANFVSGVFITLQKPLVAGDIIKSSDFFGKVEIVRLRDTIIRTFDGHTVSIPNKDIFQNPLINFTSSGKRRLDLQVGVSYGDDLDKVEAIVKQATANISVLSKENPVQVFYESFGDSSINFNVSLWLNDPEQSTYLQGRSEAIKFIKTAFDANNITIPFPIRTLDFGIKGGENLSSMLHKN